MLLEKIPQEFEKDFENLWERNACPSDFFNLAKQIDSQFLFSQFNYGWQHRVVLHENLDVAKTEFCMIITGCI